ncbi:hypothetical protein GQ53DRAFT_660067 [Thozetella sp. PMI_491]|nr:hypothetical protein GQ53DRAFT_660067 [Thozetella sp. PMI_491]
MAAGTTRNGRLGSRKSRNGCLQCKARRVKVSSAPLFSAESFQCDEQVPCGNCTRHDAQCSLIRLVSIQGPYRLEPKDGDLAIETEPSLTESFAERTVAIGGASAIPAEGSISSTEWMQSLRLLHHYHTSTSLTLGHDDRTLRLWQITVPNIALSHEPVMNGLLAVSALHYAYIHQLERKQYTVVAFHYQSLALTFFSRRLTDMTEASCESYFLMGALMFILTAHSITGIESDKTVSLNDIVQSFILQRGKLAGVRSILESPIAPTWKYGQLSTLFECWDIAQAAVIGPDDSFTIQLDRLSSLIRERLLPDQDVDCRLAYFPAIEALREVYFICNHSTNPGSHMWHWASKLSQRYLDLLNDGQPGALTILAYFAALARSIETGSWVHKGWSASVMAVIQRSLDSADWKVCIEWPATYIFKGQGHSGSHALNSTT